MGVEGRFELPGHISVSACFRYRVLQAAQNLHHWRREGDSNSQIAPATRRISDPLPYHWAHLFILITESIITGAHPESRLDKSVTRFCFVPALRSRIQGNKEWYEKSQARHDASPGAISSKSSDSMTLSPVSQHTDMRFVQTVGITNAGAVPLIAPFGLRTILRQNRKLQHDDLLPEHITIPCFYVNYTMRYCPCQYPFAKK